jgi:hypothetical protein
VKNAASCSNHTAKSGATARCEDSMLAVMLHGIGNTATQA